MSSSLRENFKGGTMRKLCLGEFNAESTWDDTGTIRLPRVVGPQSSLIESMDELLWGFIEHNEDMLVTKTSFDVCLKDYLSDSGIHFKTSTWGQLKKEEYDAEPYAITPGVIKICRNLGMQNSLPKSDKSHHGTRNRI